MGNKTVIGYPDGTQADYYYDAENRLVELYNTDQGLYLFEYDANGNLLYKEYPNQELAYYYYDKLDRVIQMDEWDLGGKKLHKTTYSWDAEGNRLTERQFNHGQSTNAAAEEVEAMSLTLEDGIALASDKWDQSFTDIIYASLDWASDNIADIHQTILMHFAAEKKLPVYKMKVENDNKGFQLGYDFLAKGMSDSGI